MKGFKYLAFLCLLCLTVIVGIDGTVDRSIQASVNTFNNELLPTVGSYENLKKILKATQNRDFYGGRIALGMNGAVLEKAEEAKAATATDSGVSGGGGGDYSKTNVQVRGVDEADTVKTDGEYIYKITNNKLVVAKAYPAEEIKVVSTIVYNEQMFPAEMYVDNKHLIVILNQSYYNLREPLPVDGIVKKEKMPRIGPFESSIKVIVYDLADRTNLKQVREVEIDGEYVSSRKVGNNLYLVNNKFIPVHLLETHNEELPTPAYRDSAEGNEVKRIGYADICYFPGSPEANYLIIASINLDSMTDSKTEIKTYLGAGQNIYSSLENLFVAVPEYKFENVKPLPQTDTPDTNRPEASLVKPSILLMPTEENTAIYKFSLKEGSTEYVGKGTVTGRILNQFSMDEHNGYFRIATTEQKYTPNSENMTNHLFILGASMNIKGKIENIAPGEKIYSVRFLGDRGYMVTFKTVDPLFVLDLKDPSEPKILGELKIPGYSNYLHTYDENHIIGFGKEAIEVEEPHWSGQGTTKNAYYLGMKIALFDVSDVNNPKEKFKVEIGDRGTDSELFWNHKALLFSKEKNLMAFPVTVCERDPVRINKDEYLTRIDPRLAYGIPVFQGAMVYNLTENGFNLKGMVTHQPDGRILDLQRTGQYDYNRDISRVLYIDDTIYTISNGYLKASDLDFLQEKGGITILN